MSDNDNIPKNIFKMKHCIFLCEDMFLTRENINENSPYNLNLLHACQKLCLQNQVQITNMLRKRKIPHQIKKFV